MRPTMIQFRTADTDGASNPAWLPCATLVAWVLVRDPVLGHASNGSQVSLLSLNLGDFLPLCLYDLDLSEACRPEMYTPMHPHGYIRLCTLAGISTRWC